MYHILEEKKLTNCKALSIQISLYLKIVRDYSCWSHRRVIMTQKHRLRLFKFHLPSRVMIFQDLNRTSELKIPLKSITGSIKLADYNQKKKKPQLCYGIQMLSNDILSFQVDGKYQFQMIYITIRRLLSHLQTWRVSDHLTRFSVAQDDRNRVQICNILTSPNN